MPVRMPVASKSSADTKAGSAATAAGVQGWFANGRGGWSWFFWSIAVTRPERSDDCLPAAAHCTRVSVGPAWTERPVFWSSPDFNDSLLWAECGIKKVWENRAGVGFGQGKCR